MTLARIGRIWVIVAAILIAHGAWATAPDRGPLRSAQARPAATPMPLGPCAAVGGSGDGGTPLPRSITGSPGSGPTPTPLPLANPDDREAISAAVFALLSCWRDADPIAIAALSAASAPPELPQIPAWLAVARAAAETSLTAVSNVRGASASRASADVHWRQGNLEHDERWYFDAERGGWRLRSLHALAANGRAGAVGIPVSITASSIAASRSRLVSPGRVVLRVGNGSGAPCTFAVMRLSDQPGGDPGSSPTSAGQVEAASYAGSSALAPGETAELAFVDLAPGRYALVALGERELFSTLTIDPA